MVQKHLNTEGFSLKNGIYRFPKNVSVATWIILPKFSLPLFELYMFPLVLGLTENHRGTK